MHPNRIINEDLDNIVAVNNIDWGKFNNKTILVTGANGFLPAYMVETLLHLQYCKIIENVNVIALVRNKGKAEQKFLHHRNNSSLIIFHQDVCEAIDYPENIDFIIHAASQASPKYYGIDPVGTLKANVTGTINLCEFAIKNPIESFIYFSSSEVYGKVQDNIESIKETDYGYLDPMNVRSCYGESKRMGETICISYLHQFGVPVKVVRPTHTYGPGMELNDGRVFADFVRDIVNGQNIIMNSAGNASRSFCYLSDATLAFFKILLYGKNGEAYNMANPACEITILELAERLIAMFSEKELKVIKKKQFADGYLVSKNTRNFVSIEKLQQLDWTPTVNIENGFYRTILSYKIKEGKYENKRRKI